MVALFGKKKRQEASAMAEAKKATATAALKAERRMSLKQETNKTATKQVVVDLEVVPTPLRQQVSAPELVEPDHTHDNASAVTFAISSLSDCDESLDYSTSQNTNKTKAKKSPVQSQPTKKRAVRRGSLSNVPIPDYSNDISALL